MCRRRAARSVAGMERIQHLSTRGLRRLRNAVVAILSLVLYAAPVAGANDHPFLTPSSGGLVGEAWARIYSLPTAENPFTSDRNQCLRLDRDVVEAVSEHPCTIRRGTGVMLYLGSAWSNAEAPYPADEAAQRAAAFAADQTVSEIRVTVDGATPIDIRTPRFRAVLTAANRAVARGQHPQPSGPDGHLDGPRVERPRAPPSSRATHDRCRRSVERFAHHRPTCRQCAAVRRVRRSDTMALQTGTASHERQLAGPTPGRRRSSRPAVAHAKGPRTPGPFRLCAEEDSNLDAATGRGPFQACCCDLARP